MRFNRLSGARALRLLPLAALAGLLVGLAPGASASSTTTFSASADTYVSSANPSTNYGSGLYVRADGSPTSWSLVRFTVANLPGAVTKATLQLYSSSASNAGFDVRRVSGAWDERTVTYNTAPSQGSVIGSSGSFGSGAWTSIDVTSAVSGNGTYAFALTGRSATNLSLFSRESGHAAKLVVVTADGTSTSSSSTTSAPPPSSTSTTSSTTTTTTPSTTSTTTPSSTSTSTSTSTTTSTSAPPPPPPSSGGQPGFPIRAAFYYPWFPEAWDQQGMNPFTHYSPTAGFYDESQTSTEQRQISDLTYAGMDAAIASWWGQGSNSDQRLGLLLSTTAAMGSPLKWSIYYEPEGQGDPSVSQIVSDLQYIKSHYASSSAYLKINGRFVVFVWADGSDGANMASRWKQASDAIGHAAYIVLKVFNGFQNYVGDADSWHQYGPAVPESAINGYSFSISPGFWKANESSPRLARDVSRFRQNVSDMVNSGAPWQLVTTYNEWGEGTAVESASQWASTSGHGQYIDALHAGIVGGSAPPPSTSTSTTTTTQSTSTQSTSTQSTPSTTTTPADTTPPTKPASLQVSAADQTSVTLGWAASSDDVGVAGYTLYLNGNKLTTTSQTSYRFPNLSCGSTYTLGVDAYDAAGNHSSEPTTTTATAACTTSSSGPCGTTTTAPSTYDHVVWIIFENHAYSQVIGSSSAPYINKMANECGLATNFSAETHPSLPNYLAMTSGSPQGVTDDGSPSSHPIGAASIFSQVGNWRSLQESMPSNCDLGNSGQYYVKHNPAAYYTGIRTACGSLDVPLGSTPDISAKFTFVTPNICNDMHDCSVATGDKWLSTFLPKLLGSSEYAAGRTAIFVTWDEDDGSSSNHIATFVIAPSVPAGTQVSTKFNHYSMLRTTEEMLGINTFLGGAASAASMRSGFHF